MTMKFRRWKQYFNEILNGNSQTELIYDGQEE